MFSVCHSSPYMETTIVTTVYAKFGFHHVCSAYAQWHTPSLALMARYTPGFSWEALAAKRNIIILQVALLLSAAVSFCLPVPAGTQCRSLVSSPVLPHGVHTNAAHNSCWSLLKSCELSPLTVSECLFAGSYNSLLQKRIQNSKIRRRSSTMSSALWMWVVWGDCSSDTQPLYLYWVCVITSGHSRGAAKEVDRVWLQFGLTTQD